MKKHLLIALTSALCALFLPRTALAADGAAVFAAAGRTQAISLPNGKIIIAGSFNEVNGTAVPNIARLLPDGRLDSSFSAPALAGRSEFYVVVQNDGKLLVTGNNSVPGSLVLLRLNEDGSVDQTFQPPPTFEFVTVIGVAKNGRILVRVRERGDFLSDIKRLNADGTVDPTFVSGIGPAVVIYTGFLLLPDERILLWSVQGSVIRLRADGSVDSSFQADGGINGVRSLGVQPDGSIVLNSNFFGSSGFESGKLLRLNTDGSLDQTFEGPSEVRLLVVENGGSILISRGTSNFFLQQASRLDAEGNVDPTFSPGFWPAQASIAAVEADDSYLLDGSFTTFENARCTSLVRVDSAGVFDRSFLPAITRPGSVYALAPSAEHTAVAAGDFFVVNGIVSAGVAKINADGTSDPSLQSLDLSSEGIGQIAVQRSGRVLVGGFFTRLDDLSFQRLTRLSPAGGIDPTFQSPDPNSFFPGSIAVQSDDRIVVSGGLQTKTGFASLFRLNPDGDFDPTFATRGIPIRPGSPSRPTTPLSSQPRNPGPVVRLCRCSDCALTGLMMINFLRRHSSLRAGTVSFFPAPDFGVGCSARWQGLNRGAMGFHQRHSSSQFCSP